MARRQGVSILELQKLFKFEHIERYFLFEKSLYIFHLTKSMWFFLSKEINNVQFLLYFGWWSYLKLNL